MSAISNRRALLEATQRLVKMSAPDLDDYKAVAQALAQVITDDAGVPIKVVLRASATDIDRARTTLGAES